MIDTENQGLEQELQPETSLQSESEVAPEPVAEKKTPQVSFRELKAAKERAERERDEMARMLQNIDKSRSQAADVPEEDEEINIGPDDLAEGKHLSKVTKKIKNLEKQVQEYEQKAYQAATEARIKAQYPDFDKVVSEESIAILSETYPEIAATLKQSTDLYTTAVSAYTLMKQFGITTEDNYAKDRERIQKNAEKPRPLVSGTNQQGTSPLQHANAFANGLTEDLKQQLYKEMQAAQRNY